MSEQTEIAGEPTYGSQQPSAMKAAERPWCLSSEEWVRNYVLRPPPEVLEPRATEADYAAATKQSFQVARRSPPTPGAEWKGLEKARDCVARYPACQACCAATAASPRMQVTSRPPPQASPPSPIRLQPRGPRHMPVDSPMESVAALRYLRPKPPKKSQRKGQ